MANAFKKLKLELFFLYKLINPRYTPVCRFNFRCYANYFKNRFLQNFIMKNVPEFYTPAVDNFELHTLCQKSDIWPLVWTLRSFMFQSGLYPHIIIHDDGSFDLADIKFLESKFDNLNVLRRSDADKMVFDKIAANEKALKYRKCGHPLILKLIDIFLLSKSEKILVLDSDILFFSRPVDIIEFVEGKKKENALISGIINSTSPFEILVNDGYKEKYGLISKKTEFMNSGIILYNKDSIALDKLYEYFENCQRDFSDYFVEMTGWNCLVAQTNHSFLPPDRYIIKGAINDKTVAKHFTSGRRQELFACGIDAARNKIDEQNKQSTKK